MFWVIISNLHVLGHFKQTFLIFTNFIQKLDR